MKEQTLQRTEQPKPEDVAFTDVFTCNVSGKLLSRWMVLSTVFSHRRRRCSGLVNRERVGTPTNELLAFVDELEGRLKKDEGAHESRSTLAASEGNAENSRSLIF